MKSLVGTQPSEPEKRARAILDGDEAAIRWIAEAIKASDKAVVLPVFFALRLCHERGVQSEKMRAVIETWVASVVIDGDQQQRTKAATIVGGLLALAAFYEPSTLMPIVTRFYADREQRISTMEALLSITRTCHRRTTHEKPS
jgi:hypothetical protein